MRQLAPIDRLLTRVDNVTVGASRACPFSNFNRFHADFRLRPCEVDVQQSVIEPRPRHVDRLGQHERSLKLPSRNAPMQVHAPCIGIGLAPTDHKLVILLRDLQVVHREPGDGQGDA